MHSSLVVARCGAKACYDTEKLKSILNLAFASLQVKMISKVID